MNKEEIENRIIICEQMKELFILAVLVMTILIYEIIQTKKENKILKNNYNTALKILLDSDPKLREYLEREGM